MLGIQYIHSRNIIHRDIKLENILIDNLGVVKICDFGVSKLLENSESKATECSGTPAYMAPEVVLCEAINEVNKPKKKSSKKVLV